MVLRVNSAPETFVRVTQKQYNMDMLDVLKVAAEEHYAHLAAASHRILKGIDPEIKEHYAHLAAEEHYAHLAAASHRILKGLDPEINPDRPPKN